MLYIFSVQNIGVVTIFCVFMDCKYDVLFFHGNIIYLTDDCTIFPSIVVFTYRFVSVCVQDLSLGGGGIFFTLYKSNIYKHIINQTSMGHKVLWYTTFFMCGFN